MPKTRQRAAVEQRLAVAAAAEGAVDIDGIVARRQRGEHSVEKNRNVPGRSDRLRRDPRLCGRYRRV